MTGVQAQAAKLLEQIRSMSFSIARSGGSHLDIGKMEVMQMALEKQVPMHPDMQSRFAGGTCYQQNHLCGRCSYNLSAGIVFKYCPKCGQAIDWRNK